MAQQLLKTKFHLPHARADIVHRARLVDLIDRGSEGPLTLITAPAGSGKSTLVSEWRKSEKGKERQFAWLSLDSADSDPVRFFTYFAAALDEIHPGIGDTAASLFRASSMGAQRSEILIALINEIAEIPDDFVLGLDDYHVITDPQVHEMMATFVENMPPQMHLLIATRHDPQLPLARLRARGALTEIRGPDLQFFVKEASTMLRTTEELELPEALIADLTERAEGWAAGLHLFALSTRGRSATTAELEQRVASFSGGQNFIFDYLAGEIFDQSDQPTQDFLLKTSLLERMTGPLCNKATGASNGDEMLSRLVGQNLFLIPLDDERRWYRYHHLFQDFLRSHAGGLSPQDTDEVHRNAAAWYEANGMPTEAIDQAQAMGDHETVARLLVVNYEEFQRIGHFNDLIKWSASLPDEMVRKRPRLALIKAAGGMLTEQDPEINERLISWAEDAISEIERQGGFDPEDDVDGTVVGIDGLDALKGEVLAVRYFGEVWRLPPEEATRMAGQALELLPPRAHHIRGMVHLLDAEIQIGLGTMNSVLSMLERGVHEARQAQDYSLLIYALSGSGQINAAMGRLEAARRFYEDALAVGQHAAAEVNWVMSCPHFWLAELFIEHGDLTSATDHIAIALGFTFKSPMMGFAVNVHTTAAQVSVAAGDTEAALEHFTKAQQFNREFGGFDFSSFLSSVAFKIYCSSGDLEAAANNARDRNLSPAAAADYANEEEMTAYGRYLIAKGDYSDAEQVLSKVLPILRSGGRVQHEIHVLALHALTYELLGERALALEALGRATMLGEPGRFNRTFTSEGPVMTGLLQALENGVQRDRGPAESGSRSYLQYLLHQAGGESELNSSLGDESEEKRDNSRASLPDPLSEREIEVLTLVVSGATNQQIAEHLVVSMSTVKSHINRIYRKLDARSRTQAVAKGRQLGIV